MAHTGSASRGRIAANVSAELTRKRMTTMSLVKLFGGSYSYWHRRTSGEIPFAAEELLDLADLLDVPIGRFFEGARDTGTPPTDQ